MKKFFTLSVVMILSSTLAFAQSTATIWAKTVLNDTYPNTVNNPNGDDYTRGGNATRGFGFGTFEGNRVLVVVTTVPRVSLVNPDNGDFIKTLNVTGVSGGAIPACAAQVTDDGKILVSNVRVQDSGAPFKVYMWSSSSEAPTVAINYTENPGFRFGDKFTVTGSINAGTAKLYATASRGTEGFEAPTMVFSMIADPANPGKFKFNPTPSIFTMHHAPSFNYTASVSFLPDGTAMYKAPGSELVKLNTDGTPSEDVILGVVLDKSSSDPKYVTTVADSVYIAAFTPGQPNERAIIAKIVKDNWATAEIAIATPTLGNFENIQGLGGLQVERINGEVFLYVMSTNNGLGKYKFNPVGKTSGVETSGVDNSLAVQIKIRQNAGSINIEGVSPSEINIYSTLGQKVLTSANSNVVNTGLLKGVHVIQIKVGNKEHRQKLLLK